MNWKDDLRTPSWANLQLVLVVAMLIAANLSIAISQLALGGALIVLLIRRFLRREPVAATGLGRWVLALAVWALLMIPFSSDPGQSLIFYKRFFLFSAIWVVGSVAVTEPRQWILMAAILTGAVAISLYGQIHIWQQAGTFFNERLGAMSNPMTSGCLLMMSLLLAMGFLLSRGGQRRQTVALVAAALTVGLGLVQTMTRSAWLGLAVGLGTMLLVARPRLFGVFAAVVILVLLGAPQLPDSILSDNMKDRIDPAYFFRGNSTSQRVYMWREGWAMVKQHPVTGVGDCDLRSLGPDYYQHPDMTYHGHLHSNPVMLAAIWGLPGLVLGMGFLFLQLRLLLRRWKFRSLVQGRAAGPWILAGLGVWAGFFTAGFTEWYFGDAESMLLYLAMMGVALGLPLAADPSGAPNV